MDKQDATSFILANGKALQVMLWSGQQIPDGWVPLDGRTVEGVTLPDRRDKFLYATKSSTDYTAVYSLVEMVRLHDLKNANGEVIMQGVFP